MHYPTIIIPMDRIHSPLENCSDTRDSSGNGERHVFYGRVHIASLAVCTVLIFFAILLGCIGNGIVLFSAFKWRKLRTNFDVLVINLTGADFITCTCLTPIFLILLFVDPPTPKIFCGSILFLGTISAMLSLLTLVAIALHRLARVIGHARGTTSLTRIGIIIVLIWIVSLVLSIGGTFHMTTDWDDSFKNCQPIINSPNPAMQNFVLYFLAPVTIVSFSIITLSYIIIAWVVQKQVNSASENNSPRCSSPRENMYRQCRDLIGDKRKMCSPTRPCVSCASQNLLNKDSKAVTMCLVVILTMGLCWGPLIMSQFIELATGESIILYQVKLCGIGLVFLNSALDPYIYAQHIGKMKQKYTKLFKILVKCCVRKDRTSRLHSFAQRNANFYRSRSLHYDFESNSVPAKTSTNIKKILDKCVGSSRGPASNFYRQNLLINTDLKYKTSECVQSKTTLKQKAPCNFSDYSMIAEDANGIINASCSQGTPKDGQSWTEDQLNILPNK
ncbi:hypothetical protein FSP39_009695 [Pinctada imbricata]|uniref:G-protein coupled receptors family 1 profile domain-containing protein n=1 Tax=Pinctada imbricata TaxID=66713 RepID=A0AA88XW53_PINIB|nr:hypothetical protein FSP39_009695 [Pinctada imbricata]